MLNGSFRKHAGKFITVLGVTLCVTACEKDMPYSQPQGTGIQPTLSSIQANVFNVKCAVAACHVSTGIAPMSLETGLAYGTLVNVNSAYGSPLLLRVKPNDAANSALYLKVIGDAKTGGSQNRMPLGLGSVTTAEANAIQTWINNGAQNN